MKFNHFDDIFFVLSEDFGRDSGMFFFSTRKEGDADGIVKRFVRKFEKECGWEKDSVDYAWFWLSSLTKPDYLTKDDFHDIWAIASTTVQAGTNNNDSLARLVAEIAGIKCGEIEIDE